jgi:hypothetical protein
VLTFSIVQFLGQLKTTSLSIEERDILEMNDFSENGVSQEFGAILQECTEGSL